MFSRINKTIKTIEALSIDMMYKSKIAYPEVLLRSTDLLCNLYGKILMINPDDPKWLNRDRFVLASSHNSAMLYSTLHLAGYDISKDDLEEYCLDGSKTPLNLDPRITPGVDAPEGSLGEGVAIGVGMAIAGKYLAEHLNEQKQIINYKVYIFCSIEDIKSGVAQEALSLAGELRLNNLVLIFEYNKNDLNAEDKIFVEDVYKHLQSYRFDVYNTEIYRRQFSVILNRKNENKNPQAIIINNNHRLGLVFDKLYKLKGEEITQRDYKCIKKAINFCKNPFEVLKEEREYLPELIKNRCLDSYNLWQEDYNFVKKNGSSKVKKIIKSLEEGNLIIDFESENFKIKNSYYEDLAKSNIDIMKIINKRNSLLMGGSNDVFFNKTKLTNCLFLENNYESNTINFGNRLNSLGFTLIGMSLCGLRVFSVVPLIHSDCMKSSIRLSANLGLPITYIYTNDTPYSVLDGSMYQPVDQIGMLRNMINVNVFRPADIVELFGVWEYILKNNNKPNILLLGSEQITIQEGTNSKKIKDGAYIIKEHNLVDAIIICTGNEVPLGLEIANSLKGEYEVRVVSMPSMNLYLENKNQNESIFLKQIPTFVIEASHDANWLRFATSMDHIFGINKYGKCSSKELLKKHYNLDKENILKEIKKML